MIVCPFIDETYHLPEANYGFCIDRNIPAGYILIALNTTVSKSSVKYFTL